MGEELGKFRVIDEPLIEKSASLAITDKNIEIAPDLLEPSYIDTRFIGKAVGVTIFIASGYEIEQRSGADIVIGAIYNSSDKLIKAFDFDNYDKASQEAAALVGNKRSARYFEELLRILYRNPQAELVHMLTGIDVSNGLSYNVFGTINAPEKKLPKRKIGFRHPTS